MIGVNDKTLGRDIQAWSKRKSAVVNDLHKLVVRAICHCICNGDVRYVNELDVAVLDGTDTNGKAVSGINLFSFRKYMDEKAPVSFVKADKATGKPDHWTYSKDKAESIKPLYDANPAGFAAELNAKPFWHVVKAPDPFDGFDLIKAIKAQVAKARKYISDPSKKDKVDITGIERIEKLLPELEKAKANNNETAEAIAKRFAITRAETADPVANAKTVQRRKPVAKPKTKAKVAEAA